METHSVQHPAAVSAVIGALVGGALGTYGFIVFVLVAPTLQIHVGISHPLYAFLFITVPVPIGALVGWWQSARVLRFGSWCLDRLP
jgi:hypothetical protein